MADNVTTTLGVMATDEISSAHYQRIKLTAGADGFATDVSIAAPLPTSSTGDPATGAFAVTPHNTTALSQTTRALYIGGAGDVAVTMAGGGDVTFAAVAAGYILPIRVTHVKVTGTTATNIVGLY